MIGLLRNDVICTVKDADMPILFCTFSHLLSPPFRVNMVTTKGKKARNYGGKYHERKNRKANRKPEKADHRR
jgi:hypothetical protein